MKKVPLFSGCGFQNEGLRKQESHLSRRFSVTVGTTVYSIFFYASSSVWDGLLTTSAFFFLHECLFGKKIKKMPIHDLANVSGQARGWSCGKADWSCSSVQGRSFGLRSIAE